MFVYSFPTPFLFIILDFTISGRRAEIAIEHRAATRKHGERDRQTRGRIARQKTTYYEARSQVGRSERLRRS